LSAENNGLGVQEKEEMEAAFGEMLPTSSYQVSADKASHCMLIVAFHLIRSRTARFLLLKL